MHKSIIVVIAVVGLGAIGFLFSTGSMEPAIASPDSDEITFLCRETGALVRGAREEDPDAIAAPDCPTLVQALYCPACQAWNPYPPPAALERMPMGPICPKHRTGLCEEIPPEVE